MNDELQKKALPVLHKKEYALLKLQQVNHIKLVGTIAVRAATVADNVSIARV
jgi:hypothetical protein